MQQRTGIGGEQQRRQQVFEEGAAPAEQQMLPAAAYMRAAEAAEVSQGYLPGADGDEGQQPRLAGKKVVMIALNALPWVAANEEQLCFTVIDGGKLHLLCQRVQPRGQGSLGRVQLAQMLAE